MTVVGVVAHVGVVASFKSEQSGRALDCACYFVVAERHYVSVIVENVDKHVGRGLVTLQYRLVGRCLECKRSSRSYDVISGRYVAVIVARLHSELAGSVGNVPMYNAALVVVGLHGSDLLAVKQQACLRLVGVAHNPYRFSVVVVPGVPRVDRQIVAARLGVGAYIGYGILTPQ